MADSGKEKPPTNYLDYFGADATPLLNFYSVQKQHDQQRQQEEKTLQARRQAQAMIQAQEEARRKAALAASDTNPSEFPRPAPTISLTLKIEDDSEYKAFIASLSKCVLHPIKPSQNCRTCKRNKEGGGKKALEIVAERQKRHPEITYTYKDAVISQNSAGPKADSDPNLSEVTSIQSYGDPASCNMNDLLKNNILTSQYFKELLALPSCEEVVAQIEYHCKHAEPFTLGTNNIPSTLFCCLFRLMVLRLTEYQVATLLNSANPYTRCTGALYIRYLAKPDELWRRLSPYLLDEQEFAPSADAEAKSTFGEYVEGLLLDLNYYGTRLPRPPILIEKDIHKKLALYGKKRERMGFNKENYNLLVKGAECFCLSSKDFIWRFGVIVSPEANMKFVRVKLIGEDETEAEENLDLGSLILASCIKDEGAKMEERPREMKVEEPKKEKSRSRSRSRHRHEHGGRHHHHHSGKDRSGSRSKHRSKSRSRSRSRSKDHHDPIPKKPPAEKPEQSALARRSSILTQLNEENKRLAEEALENEREQVLATSKSDYARRPASYKSALSLALPVGTVRTRKKSKSKSPRRLVVEVPMQAAKSRSRLEEIEEKSSSKGPASAEHYAQMQKIKEKYGATQGANKARGGERNATRDRDETIGPEVVKFGIRK